MGMCITEFWANASTHKFNQLEISNAVIPLGSDEEYHIYITDHKCLTN